MMELAWRIAFFVLLEREGIMAFWIQFGVRI